MSKKVKLKCSKCNYTSRFSKEKLKDSKNLPCTGCGFNLFREYEKFVMTKFIYDK